MFVFICAPTDPCQSIVPIMFTVRIPRLEIWTSFVECAHRGGEESRWRKERRAERRGSGNQKWKKRRGTLIDSCLAWCLLRLFPPSTAIISRRTSPSPWQGLCHPSPLEDAIPFGRRWIGVPSPRMRSLWTESLQREHSGVNRLYVNTSISDISVENTLPQSDYRPSDSWVSNCGICLWWSCGRRAHLNHSPPLFKYFQS